MEWLLKQAIEHAGKSYSPEKVADMLDAHQAAIESILKNNYWWGLFFLLVIGILAIRSEIKYYIIGKKINKIDSTSQVKSTKN